jgi:hypothetical protein
VAWPRHTVVRGGHVAILSPHFSRPVGLPADPASWPPLFLSCPSRVRFAPTSFGSPTRTNPTGFGRSAAYQSITRVVCLHGRHVLETKRRERRAAYHAHPRVPGATPLNDVSVGQPLAHARPGRAKGSRAFANRLTPIPSQRILGRCLDAVRCLRTCAANLSSCRVQSHPTSRASGRAAASSEAKHRHIGRSTRPTPRLWPTRINSGR